MYGPIRLSRPSLALLLGLLATALGCAPDDAPSSDPATPEARPEAGDQPTLTPLTVASFGGAWQDAQREAMFAPFAESSGVEVAEVEYDGSYDELRAQGDAGAWDVVDVEPVELLRGAAEGAWAPLELGDEAEAALVDGAVRDGGVALMTWAVVMGYDAGRFPTSGGDGDTPRSWADFWNVERFPGERALRGTPEWMLEIALLADGVAPGELYPLDLDRAFESLARIEDHVVFFDDWAQPARWLEAGDVAFAVGTNGRLAGREGIGVSWSGNLVSSDYFVIPAGSRNIERARELVRYAVGADAQSAFPRLIDYGPTNREAQRALPDDVLERLPSHPEHAEESIPFDAGWWLEHEDEAHRRYDAWRAGLP